MTTRPARGLLVAVCVMLAAVFGATPQPAHAAPKVTDLDVIPRYTQSVNDLRLRLDVYNAGPDTAPFEIIAWYSILIEFPTSITPAAGECDLVEYEDRGPYTVGICTSHGEHHFDLPLGFVDVAYIDFFGQPAECESMTVTVRLDAALRDPTPVRETRRFGGIGTCDR